jgi:hypothetical protein
LEELIEPILLEALFQGKRRTFFSIQVAYWQLFELEVEELHSWVSWSAKVNPNRSRGKWRPISQVVQQGHINVIAINGEVLSFSKVGFKTTGFWENLQDEIHDVKIMLSWIDE